MYKTCVNSYFSPTKKNKTSLFCRNYNFYMVKEVLLLGTNFLSKIIYTNYIPYIIRKPYVPIENISKEINPTFLKAHRNTVCTKNLQHFTEHKTLSQVFTKCTKCIENDNPSHFDVFNH